MNYSFAVRLQQIVILCHENYVRKTQNTEYSAMSTEILEVQYVTDHFWVVELATSVQSSVTKHRIQ